MTDTQGAKPEDTEPDDPRGDLENALTQISAFQSVLRTLGESDMCFEYLAERLGEHYDDAHDAFARLFKLNEYAEKQEARP